MEAHLTNKNHLRTLITWSVNRCNNCGVYFFLSFLLQKLRRFRKQEQNGNEKNWHDEVSFRLILCIQIISDEEWHDHSDIQWRIIKWAKSTANAKLHQLFIINSFYSYFKKICRRRFVLTCQNICHLLTMGSTQVTHHQRIRSVVSKNIKNKRSVPK